MRVNRPGEPSYAGIGTFDKLPLVLDPEELRGVDVAIVGAPIDETTVGRPGTRFGPTATTVAHCPRLLTVAAVAGIRSPPLDRRSPSSSGRRTRTRSDIIVTALAAARSGIERTDRFATRQGYAPAG